jgi:predicted Fe-Mo cluster-binding NifX family protein
MIVCLPVTADGQVGPSWGRAERVAIADVGETGIGRWDEFEVGWDQTHDAVDHGSHHARIARFLIENQVGFVVAGHMGPPMVQMLSQMGIGVQLDASGEARSAAIAAGR